jgi:DNA-binding CsgD family transcriptional regulator
VGRGQLRGRSGQMEHVLDLLRRTARTGRGAVLIVQGEAGIGKTAVLQAAAEQAGRLGFAVGSGRADESARIAPMAALFTALRSGRVPVLPEDAFLELAPLYDRELRLVDRLAGALEERAAQTPLLIIVDDVHWADDLSVFALRILPGRLGGSPIVWLLASRTGARGIDQAAEHDLPVSSLDLGPLDDAAIEELAVDRLGAAPDQRLRALLRGAEGNPFLAVELLAGLIAEQSAAPKTTSGSAVSTGRLAPDDPRQPLPARLLTGVRDALASLPEPAVQLARAGSILGRSFTAQDVAGLLDGPTERSVLPGLEPLIRAGVLTDDGAALSFRHDLLRQAVYDDIPPTVRKAMHRAAARHLMSIDRSPVDAAAHVLVSAAPGDLEAVNVLRQAAQVVAAMAPGMAVNLILAAFALVTPDDRLWLNVGRETIAILAQARHAQHAADVADQLLGHAAAADTVARADFRVSVESLLTLPMWSMGLLGELRERAEKGLAADGLSAAGRARLAAQVALASSRDEDVPGARSAGQQALAAAQGLGDAAAEATALWALGEIERNDGRNEAALGHFERLRMLAGSTYSVDEIITLQLLDRYDVGAAKIAEAETDLAGRGANAPQIVVAFARMWQAYSLGRLDEAETDASTVLRLGSELGEYMFLTEARLVLSRVAQLRGDPAATREQLELAEAIPRADDGTTAMMLLFMRAWLAESEGDLAGALEPARTVVRETLEFRHRCRWEASWMVEAARIAVRNGDGALADEVADLAGTLAARNPDVPTAVGTARHIDGLIADDPAMLASAVEALRAGPRPLLLADALADHGRALLRRGLRAEAIAALDQAGTAFRQLGARGELARLHKELRAAGLRRNWVVAPARPKEGWAALTEAECRVAALIAEGRTNKSVAAELLLSPNTVATHLRAVFAKMNVNSRAQLARAVLALPSSPTPVLPAANEQTRSW